MIISLRIDSVLQITAFAIVYWHDSTIVVYYPDPPQNF